MTDQIFIDYVIDQLEPVGVVLTSKMFGGVLLKIDNKQLGIIIDGTLYFKVKEPELHRKFTQMESDPYEYDRQDRESPVRIRTWWSVPDEVLEDKRQLVGLAYEVLLQGSKG
jgi:TfoX/Sxy family transcriptional regulator of competence genes